jgi:predicted Fe-S protein YdhL (DUF1289 family)
MADSSAIETIAARAELVRVSGVFDNETPPSPCISVCRMDMATGLCEGCFRTLDEIAAWTALDDAGKRGVWDAIAARIDTARSKA